MRYSRWIIAFLFIVVLIGVFSPVIFQNKTIFPADQLHSMVLPYAYDKKINVHNHFLNDVITQYYPYKEISRKALRENDLTYWSRYTLGGYPQYALTMAGNFDVTNVILLFFDNTETAYCVQMILLLLIAGISMYALLRYFSMPVAVAFIVGVVYMLNSMFVTTLFFPWILASFCWMPLVILFLDKSLYSGRMRDIAIGGLFTGLSLLASSVQTASFVVLVLGAYAVLWWMMYSIKRDDVPHVIKAAGGILLLGVGISLVMWFPVLQLFLIDLTKSGELHLPGSGHASFIERIWAFLFLLSFIVPEFAGNIRAYDLTKLAGSTMMFYNGYIGFLPLAFGVWAVFRRRDNKHIGIFCVIALLGLIIPIFTPLLKYVYHRFFIIYIFAMSVLAAFGLKAYLEDKRENGHPRLEKYLIGIFVGIIVTICAGNAVLYFWHDRLFIYARHFVESRLYMANLLAGNSQWYVGRVEKLFDHFSMFSPSMYVPAFLIGLCVFLIWLYARRKISPRIFLGGFFVITFTQLLLFAYNWIPMVDRNEYPLYPETAATDFFKGDTDIYRVVVYDGDKDEHPVFSPNILSVYGIETINGYESVEPKTFLFYLGDLQPNLLGLCNVKYLITHDSTELPGDSWELRYRDGHGTKIYYNNYFMPRTFMRYDYRVLPRQEILRGLKKAELDIDDCVFFDKEPLRRLSREEGLPAEYKVNMAEYSSNRIRFTVDTSRDGYVIVSNTWYPGWRCSVDGKEAEIMKANYIMWSVWIPQGSHEVEFAFSPSVFTAGLLGTLLTGIFIAGILIKNKNN